MTSHTLPPLPPSSVPDTDMRARLSALTDGRVDGLAGALQDWRDEPAARQTWHTYQLIGDVMRSEDLAQPPDHDLKFLNRLRAQLDHEPAWLVPAALAADAQLHPPTAASYSRAAVAGQTPNAAPHDARARRSTGALVAASLSALALVLWLARGGLVGGEESVPVAAAGPALLAPSDTLTAESGPVLRDPRLDEFLRVHQMARGGLPVGAPGGTLQRADLQMTVGAGR